jgi:L,D-peptidoglycan transpeptidase YkuD (ErfK/YbiS/YcfS/YnhG family)
MKRSKRWLAVAGLWLAFVWWIPFGLAQTGKVAPASAAAPAAPPAATQPSGAAAVPAAAPKVAGVQSAAFIVQPSDHPGDTALGQRLFDQAVDGSRIDPFNWAVHVYKSQHRIELYYENQLFRTYHAVFGRGLAGAKAWEGDSRTPEGAYLIIAKHRSLRFRWFLRLNYPNATDEARFAELRASHTIPLRSREGSMVGIHGTDSPILNFQDVNWTLGCISVDNNDIAEMARLLPVGTLVVINP